jgi:DNA-3-methyladenine glycosylase
MPERTPRCDRTFFSGDAPGLARRLLGQRLVRILDDGTRLAGTIVETEAYLGVKDRAAHSFGGRRTPRTEPMYGPPGTAYVYFTYGMHWCLNAVCGREGQPTAVLIRALAPTEGPDAMRRLRGLAADRPLTTLCSGPARLCQALDINGVMSGRDLVTDPGLFVERVRRRVIGSARLGNSPRIGVGYAGRWAAAPLRWFIRDDPNVSPGRNRIAVPGERGLVDARGRATLISTDRRAGHARRRPVS